MSTHLSALPDGYFQCHWCQAGLQYLPDGSWPSRCKFCGLHPHPSKVDETVGGKVDPQRAKGASRNRRGDARVVPLKTEPIGQPVLGVDPGARYTGVVLRDGDAVLYSTTLVRDVNKKDPVEWMRLVVEDLKGILVTACPANTRMGIEGVSAPKGFKNGERASINPEYIIFAAVVLGGVAAEWPDALIIPPGRNGSEHITHYPPALVGRRPADLPGSSNGAGTRDHEQSAYDVAGKAARLFYPPTRPVIEGLRAPRSA